MTTLAEAAKLTSSGSTPTTMTTTVTTFPVTLPPGPVSNPNAPVTGHAVFTSGSSSSSSSSSSGGSANATVNQLFQNASLKRLFESIYGVQDGSAIETKVADFFRSRTPLLLLDDRRFATLQSVDDSLKSLLDGRSFSQLTLRERQQLHGLLALRQQLLDSLEPNSRAEYLKRQRARPVYQRPLNAVIYSIALSPTQANIDYARRVIDWQFDSIDEMNEFANLLASISKSSPNTNAGIAAKALLPIVQARVKQLQLSVTNDGKCGPDNGNRRCGGDLCCLGNGLCGKCDGSAGTVRSDLMFNGEKVLPVLPPSIFATASMF